MSTVKFTTKSMIMDGNRTKVFYTLNDDETLTVSGGLETGKPFVITLKPDHEHYAAARAAYNEKAEKRAKYQAEKPEKTEKWFIGQELKGNGFSILMDGSIDRATVTFKRKPSPEIREKVKAAGFYWSPTNKQWTRRLTNKAWQAAQELYTQLR